MSQGKLVEALAEFRTSLAIASHVAATDRSRAGWQHDEAHAYGLIGEVLIAQGSAQEAIEIFAKKASILERLIPRDPRNAYWQKALAFSHHSIADSYIAAGKLEDARSSYLTSHAIWERVVAIDPTNVQAKMDLLWSHSRLALFGESPLSRWEFIVATLRKLKEDGRLTPEQERWLPVADEGLAAIRSSKQWEWELLNLFWRTALLTHNPVRNASLVVAMVRKLHEDNRLTIEQARWLSVAEEQVAEMRRPGQ